MSSGWTRRLRHALGFRLALWYAALFVGSAVVLTGLTYLLLGASLERRDHQIILTTLRRYVAEYERWGLPGLNRAVEADAQAGRHEPLLVRVQGRDAEAVFFTMPADWTGFDLERLREPSPEEPEGWTRLRGGRGTVLDVASARLPDGTLFQVGKSSEERVEVLARFRRVVLVVLLSTVAVGLAGGALLTHWTLRPLRALAGAVRRNLDTGRLSERVPVRQTGDALDELGTLFNGMLDRIESLIAGMRGSLDNVAHDLRTPMTRLRGLAEAALQGPADVEAYRAALADCVEESERVVAMLTTLMDISEAETGTLRLHREAVEIVPILEETRSLYADLAEDEGVELGVAAPPGLTVDADRNRLRQVLANLVDNAVKYTPSGGRVEMEAHREGAWVRIVVRDTGIGIPLAEQPRVWQRLYRGDESRSERGLGLGLSLVRAVVAAHRGRVELESTPGAGAAFAVWLPAAHAPA